MLAKDLELHIRGLSHDDRVKLLSLICEEKEGYDRSLLLMFKGLLEQVDSGYWDSFAALVPCVLWNNELDAYRSDWPDSTLVERLAGDLNWGLSHWGSRTDSLPSFLSGLSAFAWDFLELDMDVMPMVYLNLMFGENHWGDIMSARKSVFTEQYIDSMLAAGMLNIAMRTNVSWLRGLSHDDPYVTDAKGRTDTFSRMTGKYYADLPDHDSNMSMFYDAVQDAIDSLGDAARTGRTWLDYRKQIARAVAIDSRVKGMKSVIEKLKSWTQHEYDMLMHKTVESGKLAVLTPSQVMASIFGADVVIK